MSQELMTSFKWLAENYGLYAAIVVSFIARDAWRDYKQDKVIQGLQSEMRGVILPIVAENAKVIAINSAALAEHKPVVAELRQAINDAKLLIASTAQA